MSTSIESVRTLRITIAGCVLAVVIVAASAYIALRSRSVKEEVKAPTAASPVVWITPREDVVPVAATPKPAPAVAPRVLGEYPVEAEVANDNTMPEPTVERFPVPPDLRKPKVQVRTIPSNQVRLEDLKPKPGKVQVRQLEEDITKQLMPETETTTPGN